MKNGSIDLKSIHLKQAFKKLSGRYGKHAIFAFVFIILLSYVFVVYKINSFANAEPGPDAQTTVTNSIPKINKKAVDQIQNLEQNNTQIHTLFEQARNNPFQE